MNLFRQAESAAPHGLFSQPHTGHAVYVADKASELRSYLHQEARKRRQWWIKSTARPNGKRMAKDLGLSQATLSRALRAHRDNLGHGGAKRPYKVSGEVEDALMAYFGFERLGDLYDAMHNAEPAAPQRPPHASPTRPRQRRR